MSTYNINIYPNGKNFKLVVKISRQPTVVYNELTLDEIIKFINSHNEFINVNAYVDKKIFNRLKREISSYYIQLEFGIS